MLTTPNSTFRYCGSSAISKVFTVFFVVPLAAWAQTDARQKMEESIARQKAAVQKQAGPPSGFFFTSGWMGGPPPPLSASAPAAVPDPPCPPMSEAEAAPLIEAAAGKQQLQPELIRAVIRRESGFRPCAVSAKGALGLMQIMPDTAEQLHLPDPFDAARNIQAGSEYLKALLDRFGGDLKLALAAYNAGPERVDGSAPAVPNIAETRDYVGQILKDLAKSPEKPDAGTFKPQY